jgi:hypothetical protein
MKVQLLCKEDDFKTHYKYMYYNFLIVGQWSISFKEKESDNHEKKSCHYWFKVYGVKCHFQQYL